MIEQFLSFSTHFLVLAYNWRMLRYLAGKYGQYRQFWAKKDRFSNNYRKLCESLPFFAQNCRYRPYFPARYLSIRKSYATSRKCAEKLRSSPIKTACKINWSHSRISSSTVYIKITPEMKIILSGFAISHS